MKKNGKILMICVLILFFMFLTWLIPSGTYTTGEYVSNGINPSGIFDAFVFMFYVFSYKGMDIIYLLMIGGTYGVLSNVGAYKKLVDKTARFIKRNDTLSMLLFTFLIGAFVSVGIDVLVPLVVIPFIVTAFLKSGKDKLTAASAGFGGLFIGLIGKTFGIYGITSLLETLELSVSSLILYKCILFVCIYALYNVCAIMHMKKTKSVNDVKNDTFITVSLDERKLKKENRKKIWPFVLVSSIVLVITVLAFIDWETSFGITLFKDVYESLGNFEIGGNPVFTNLMGSADAFGTWTTLFLNIILLISTIIIAAIDKMKVSHYVTYFQNGMKKMQKVVLTFALVNVIYVLFYYFPVGITIVNSLLGDKFNAFIFFIAGFVALLVAIDFDTIGSAFAPYFAIMFAEQLAEVSLVFYLGMAVAAVVAPTSVILMIALTYLNITYKEWLNYIWKFLLLALVAIFIVILLVCVL